MYHLMLLYSYRYLVRELVDLQLRSYTEWGYQMVKMEIISEESIKPSSKTPDHLRTYQLSLLDQFMPPSIYAPLILYYSRDQSAKQADISSLLLKRSLSDALCLYYPLAGRIMTSHENSVDCNDQGVDFLEARVDVPLSEILESPKVEVLTQLIVPSISKESSGFLLGIQLNNFTCGGIAIGISICHRVADAWTLSMFVKSWAAMASGDTSSMVAPSFIASSLFPPNEQFGQPKSFESPKHLLETRRFCFSSSKIAALRAEVGATVVQPTRVEVVTAAIWRCAIDKGHARCPLSMASHAVNIRGRMDPPLPECTFGNLIRGADILGGPELDLGELVSKMREAIGKIDGEFLKELQGENGCDMVVGHSKKAMEWFLDKDVDYFLFSSWCRFPFSESDFGWGKPVWASTAGNWAAPNMVVLMDSMSDVGGIEAWFTMAEDSTYDEI